MITKYDVGQTILFKALVRGIHINPDGNLLYDIQIDTTGECRFRDYERVAVKEDQIVCGWISEKGGIE